MHKNFTTAFFLKAKELETIQTPPTAEGISALSYIHKVERDNVAKAVAVNDLQLCHTNTMTLKNTSKEESKLKKNIYDLISI